MSDHTTIGEKDPLEYILEQINPLSLGLLWTGLTILSKDMIEFLAIGAYNGDAVTRFRKIYIKTLNDDRPYWEVYGPDLFKPLSEIEELPSGFTWRAKNGDFDLEELTTEALIEDCSHHLHYVGWELSKQAGLGLRAAICREDPEESISANAGMEQLLVEEKTDTPTEQEVEPTRQQEETLKLARKILKYGFSEATFWYPITVYIAHLLVRTGYEHLCKEPILADNGGGVSLAAGVN